MTVSIRELKNRLSEYLRLVQAGERLVVTDHGRPIAELNPLASERLSPRQRLARLVEAGEVTEPKKGRLGEVRPSRVRGRPVSETLLEDRG